jgi:hypothetical protein
MTDVDAAVPKAKSSSRRKQTMSSTSLLHEIDSAGRTRAATRILVKLPKSNASAPADLMPGVEIPESPVVITFSLWGWLQPFNSQFKSTALAIHSWSHASKAIMWLCSDPPSRHSCYIRCGPSRTPASAIKLNIHYPHLDNSREIRHNKAHETRIQVYTAFPSMAAALL